jgi:hypothetical protein
MLPESMIQAFRQYRAATPERAQNTAGWERFYNKAYTGGAHDSKPKPKPVPQRRPSRTQDFYDFYGIQPGEKIGGGMALDQHDPQRDGPLLFDRDPPPQHLVESTDAEPVDETGHPAGRAPPWGKYDLPAQRSVTEPNPTLATDPPVSERQGKAMYSAARRGESKIGIPQSVGRHFIEDQIAAELPSEERHSAQSVARGQQGEDQEEHADREQDEQLIGEHITRLVKALARDRARRRAAKDQPPTFSGRPSAPMGSEHAKLAGDRALSRGPSFYQLFPEAERLESHGSGAMLITARVFVHPSRG